MSDDQERLAELYKRFINDTVSPDELQELWSLLSGEESGELTKTMFDLYEEDIPEETASRDWSHAERRILGRKAGKRIILRSSKLVAAAASAILLIGISVFVLNAHKAKQAEIAQSEHPAKAASDVAPPSSSFATITLANGQTISVDSAGRGLLAMQHAASLTKDAEGRLVYNVDESSSASRDMIYNTLTNPRGSRVINMVLSDGSKVWLNSGSSITYPVVFGKNDRQVTITGEAYFEVARMARKKFVVSSGEVRTEVLGTQFNVSSYSDDDDIRVTLIEGKVAVERLGSGGQILSPAQQAVAENGKPLRVLNAVNTEEVTAWKNERFSFTDSNIRQIMKEVSRWYDVDVQYNGRVDDLNFGGDVSRQTQVSELLKRLEATQTVRFQINGKKITVIPISR